MRAQEGYFHFLFMNSLLLHCALPWRVTAIAWTTLTELVRMKVFYFLLIFALLMIGNSAFMARLSFQEEFQMLKDVSLGAMSVFTALLAILATAMLLPKDIEERTIYTILAKPVPRFEYLLGKLSGMLLLLLISVVLMSALFLAVLWFREQALIAQVVGQFGPQQEEEAARAAAEVRAETFQWNLLAGIFMVYLKAAIMAAITLLISTFASSGIFAMITATAVYFIGHLQATARDFWLAGAEPEWWMRGFLSAVALLFPDLQAFTMTDQVVAGVAIPWGLFWQTTALGGVYLAVYYFLAAFVFAGREL